MAFAERLKQIRKNKGLTQKEMASKLGIGFRTLQRYEDGKSFPGGGFLLELANMGFDLNWVLTGNGEEKYGSPDDDPLLRLIWRWLESESEKEPGYREWFRIEFYKRFPDFKEWKESAGKDALSAYFEEINKKSTK